MKEWFCQFALHALWRRRKALYYAVSIFSIACNLVVLFGPRVQTFILSQTGTFPAVSTLRLLQTLRVLPPHALIGFLQVVSFVCTLQSRAWNTLPQVAEVVLQRSVLYIVLNLIVVTIVLKSGMFAHRPSMVALSTKQENARLVHNFQGLSGSHSWLAPAYLNTVCSTIVNLADVSANPNMLQHVHSIQVRGSLVVKDAQTSLVQAQQHENVLYLHDDHESQVVPTMAAAPTTSFLTAARPGLFTIEPLDELVRSMKLHNIDAQMSRCSLRKVGTKVDLQQAMRQQKHLESKQKAESLHRQKDGRVCLEGKEQHVLRKKECAQQMVHLKGEAGFVHEAAIDKKGVHRKDHHVHSIMHGEAVSGRERDVENDYSELSRQEFNERVDTFLCKFKRNLTMQRKDSYNRLLGLY